MANPRSLPLALAGCGLWLLLPACELGEADVVPRAPPTPVASGRDAESSVPEQDAGNDMADPTDGPTTSREGPEAPDADVLARDGDAPDASVGQANETGEGDVDRGDARWRCQGLEFCDDFENGSAAWSAAGESWGITYDTTSVAPNAVFGPTAAATSRAYVAQAAWQDMTVEARVYVLSFGQAAIANRAELYARYQDGDHFYAVSLRGDGKLGLRKNAIAVGNAASVATIQNEWHTLKLRVSGQPGAIAITGYLDGRMLVTALDEGADAGGPSCAVGSAGLGVYGETLAHFDDVAVSSP
jgi:hypothetical protein